MLSQSAVARPARPGLRAVAGAAVGGAAGRAVGARRADDRRLAGRGHERAVLGPLVDDAVAEARHGLDADVEEHPLGRHQPVDPQRVVEAVAPPSTPSAWLMPKGT